MSSYSPPRHVFWIRVRYACWIHGASRCIPGLSGTDCTRGSARQSSVNAPPATSWGKGGLKSLPVFASVTYGPGADSSSRLCARVRARAVAEVAIRLASLANIPDSVVGALRHPVKGWDADARESDSAGGEAA